VSFGSSTVSSIAVGMVVFLHIPGCQGLLRSEIIVVS
jgi:hypothetical protein